MPKTGMRSIRRRQLIDAAIDSIYIHGLCGATVARIARRAGVSTGIVHHYFKGKSDLLAATMGSLLRELNLATITRLRRARTPRARLQAVIDASFGPEQFSENVISAWLALYGSAGQSPRLRHYVTIYHRRLRSNLRSALRPLLPAENVIELAQLTAALIDGLWLQNALGDHGGNRTQPRHQVSAMVDMYLNCHSGRDHPSP